MSKLIGGKTGLAFFATASGAVPISVRGACHDRTTHLRFIRQRDLGGQLGGLFSAQLRVSY
jgi:hypothetical protein